MKKKPFYILVMILTIFSLVLSACDTVEEESVDSADVDASGETTSDLEEAVTEEADSEAAAPIESAPGDVIYDFGFVPEENGFSFENYGDEISVTNLTAAEMRRMFGDVVCADINGDECILTPPTEQ
ncbi:MAG: hypothetical protein IPJ47_21055 [Anaerolineales bacterium]|nr:hypothetical protein [Anaerolineales bacterium]